jgi:hypothetical protein
VTLLQRLRQRVGAEDGFALVLMIGVSLVLGIAGTTSMIYTTSNETASQRSKGDRRAQALSEAGLAFAYSTLYNAPDPTQPGAVPKAHRVARGWDGDLLRHARHRDERLDTHRDR